MYPLLHRLEADGLIKSRWETETGRRRKWYELTTQGKRKLQTQAREWFALAGCLESLLKPVLKLSPEAT
jgi:PadR family transcriptional regulator, regulatory protein PadR